MIEAEALRMSKLLDELLSLARLEGTAHVFQPLDVRTMLDELAARSRALGERTIEVSGECDLWVSGDPDLLDQALLNVMRNALAHTKPGGHIWLSCQADPLEVGITVTDDGPGIAQAELDRIFDRFYRAPGPRPTDTGGAGLGLAIAKRLVDLHGGRMSAENAELGGARFTVTLPRIAKPAPGVTDARSPDGASYGEPRLFAALAAVAMPTAPPMMVLTTMAIGFHCCDNQNRLAWLILESWQYPMAALQPPKD